MVFSSVYLYIFAVIICMNKRIGNRSYDTKLYQHQLHGCLARVMVFYQNQLHFFDFLLRALRLAYENQLRKLVHLPVRSAQQASRKVENKENRARGMGRRLHPAPLCCHKKRIEVSLDALLRCLLFVMFPTAVFFIILRRLCFSRISRSGEIRCALETPSAVRNVPCAAISLRAGCVVYLTVLIALRDRSV